MKVIVDPSRPLLDGGLGPGGTSSVRDRRFEHCWPRSLKIPIQKPFEEAAARRRSRR